MEYEPYPKQREFHELGARYPHRLLTHGLRCGGTYACAAETAIHLGGVYPEWWTGHRFREAPRALLLSSYPETLEAPTLAFAHHKNFGAANELYRAAWKPIPPVYAHGPRFELEDIQRFRFRLVWFDGEPPEELAIEVHERLNRIEGISMACLCPMLGLTGFIRRYFDFADGDPRSLRLPGHVAVKIGVSDVLHMGEDA